MVPQIGGKPWFLYEQLVCWRGIRYLIHFDRMGLDPRPEDVVYIRPCRRRLQ